MGPRSRASAYPPQSRLDTEVAARSAGDPAGDQDAFVLPGRPRRHPGRQGRSANQGSPGLHLLVRNASRAAITPAGGQASGSQTGQEAESEYEIAVSRLYIRWDRPSADQEELEHEETCGFGGGGGGSRSRTEYEQSPGPRRGHRNNLGAGEIRGQCASAQEGRGHER